MWTWAMPQLPLTYPEALALYSLVKLLRAQMKREAQTGREAFINTVAYSIGWGLTALFVWAFQ
jgi:hypothetical protein